MLSVLLVPVLLLPLVWRDMPAEQLVERLLEALADAETSASTPEERSKLQRAEKRS